MGSQIKPYGFFLTPIDIFTDSITVLAVSIKKHHFDAEISLKSQGGGYLTRAVVNGASTVLLIQTKNFKYIDVYILTISRDSF